MFTPLMCGRTVNCFFRSLFAWDLRDHPTVLVGDFNCVFIPAVDRYGQHRSYKSESPALDALISSAEVSLMRGCFGTMRTMTPPMTLMIILPIGREVTPVVSIAFTSPIIGLIGSSGCPPPYPRYSQIISRWCFTCEPRRVSITLVLVAR